VISTSSNTRLGRVCASEERKYYNGLTRWKHVVIHCYRLEDNHSYRETENRLRCFSELREVLKLDLSDVPDYSTIYKSFDRLEMRACRALLRVKWSAKELST
jgi:hypothetical protein